MYLTYQANYEIVYRIHPYMATDDHYAGITGDLHGKTVEGKPCIVENLLIVLFP